MASPNNKRARTTKSVRFASSCKQHDGLQARKQTYEDIIEQFFFNQVEISELYVLETVQCDVKQCVELFGDFQDLCLRMKHEIWTLGKPHVPVLPRGGGLALRLFAEHIPYVVLLCRVIEAALNRLLHGLPIPTPSGPCVALDVNSMTSSPTSTTSPPDAGAVAA